MTQAKQAEARGLADAYAGDWELVRQHLVVDMLRTQADELDRLHAEVEQLRAQALPPGWQAVPVEPTQEMLAGEARKVAVPGALKAAWARMLASAPRPPAVQEGKR